MVTGVLEESHFTYTFTVLSSQFPFHRHLVLAHRVHHPHGENHKHHERPYETTPIGIGLRARKDYYKRVERTPRKKNQVILLCTYRCCGFHYYKYTIDGTNIFFINLLSVVIFAILDYYFLKETMHWDSWITESNFIFCLSLFSIIPLAYFIGQAVASISAQSSMGVGA